VRPTAALFSLLILVAACDSSSTPSTTAIGTTTSTSTTTTTIPNDTCERVAEDTVDFLEDLIDELDETSLVALSDPANWPDDLRRLDRAGMDLDLRVAALRCDPAEIQGAALAEADIAPDGPLSALLLELLLGTEDPGDY